MAVNARPKRQANSLKLTRFGVMINDCVDNSLASGVLSLAGSDSPVWVPYSSNSLTFIDDWPARLSSRCPPSSMRKRESPRVSMRPARAVVTELFPFSFAAIKTSLLVCPPA